MSLRLIWNSLVPWRRRRRYYFLATLARLAELDVAPADLPATFAVTPERFANFLAGREVPRLFVQSLAIMAYKVPPPLTSEVYGPVTLLTAIVLAVIVLPIFFFVR